MYTIRERYTEVALVVHYTVGVVTLEHKRVYFARGVWLDSILDES